jgi:VanZ family protein
LVICFTYGAFDEIHQIFIPNRSAELLDWIADILGATSGGLLAYFFLKRIKIR